MYLRRIALVSTLMFGLLASVVSTPTPVSAEIGDLQETWWGLETKGTSRVLDGWNHDPLGWAVEQAGGAMFVGGQFLDITNGSETIRQPYLAGFDAGDGTPLRWFTPNFGGPVLALEATSDGGLVVGGEMDEFEGNTVGALVKIDPTTGEAWPGWQTRVYGGSSLVRDIRVESDGWMYVVGDFTSANDGTGVHAVSGAIRMNPTTGTIDWNWLPQVSGGSVWGVSVSQTTNEVYLAGWFTSIGGNSSARGFGSVNTTNGSLVNGRDTVPYNTCVGCSSYYRMYDVLATEYGDVWVVGEQHSIFVLGESTLNLKYHHYTGCNRLYQLTCTRAGGEFQEIERVGDRIYATCHCWGRHQSDTQMIYHSSWPTGTATGSVSSLVAYDPQTGQRIQAVNPYMSGKAGGFAIAGASDGCLWLAGGFTQVGVVGNQRRARDLVRLCDEAGPGPDPQPDPVDPNAPTDVDAPVSCAATADDLDATITWEAPEGATDYRVYRAIDGGNTYWRGVSVTSTFTDTLRLDRSHQYSVAAKGETGVWSQSTLCDPALDGDDGTVPVVAPASCESTADGTAATISWDASDDATDYRVFRSVDGGNTYWRGKVSVTTLSDTLKTTGSHQYYVQAKGADGVWSQSTPCEPAVSNDDGTEPVVAPASCQASSVGSAATISWDASDDATDYRVFRSVDGGNTYWRGKVSITTLTDTLRSTGSHQYSVQAVGADGQWSDATTCSPALES